MGPFTELKDLLHGVRFIGKPYDVVRIVDPVKKKILNYKETETIEAPLSCFHFWEKEKYCENCVSMKAYKEKDSFIKLEYFKDQIYMIFAIPVIKDETIVVVELLKDVTNNMLVVDKNRDGIAIDVPSIINSTNTMLLIDHLTGAYNRRYIDERLQVDIINSTIQKKELSLIMADIDFFKNINDTYGHLAGDFILKEIVAILKSCIRDDKDWVARFGGEEFLVCLPNTSKEIATKIAERMRVKIEDKMFEYEGSLIKLTTSFGVYASISDQTSRIDSIIGNVDRNLYRAKQSGRNKVITS